MSEQKTALILNAMAEQAAPAAEIDLWPQLQARFAQADRAPTTGRARISSETVGFEKMRGHHPSPRLRLAALALAAVALACGLVMTTPQGRVWAQNLLRYFTRQSSDLLPTSNVPPLATQSLPLVEPTLQTTPAVTATPPGCDSILSAHCSIEQIQGDVAFPILQFGQLPKGMSLRGAVAQDQQVVLVYGCPAGCFLLLYEEPAGEAASKESIGASAQVKAVEIQTGQGTVPGEYVQGTYRGEAGDPAVLWDSGAATYSLRWETSGVRYSIQWALSPDPKAELVPDETLLIALAESLTKDPAPVLDPNYLRSVTDASLLAGFTVRVPTFIPKGLGEPFTFYAYDAGSGFVCVNYAGADQPDHPRLFVRESVTAAVTDLQPTGQEGDPTTVDYQPVAVGGAEGGSGRYVRGRFAPPENACNGQTDFQMANEALQWVAQDVSYEIYAGESSLSPSSVSKMDLVRMAESLTGVVTLPAGAPDPEHLWSIEEAETLAGFPVRAPAKLPEGYSFVLASLEDGSVSSLYQAPDPHPDMLDLTTKPPLIYLYQCPAQTDGQDPCTRFTRDVPEDVREALRIHAQPGFYAKGDLGADESTNWKMTWMPETMFMTRRLYWEEGDTAYLLQLMWGGLIDRETMIRIAESVK
jgi:hypothetical protein